MAERMPGYYLRKLRAQTTANDSLSVGDKRIVLRLLDEIDRLRIIEQAFVESEYDISPCRECGKPVMCIPEGLSVLCAACQTKERNQ